MKLLIYADPHWSAYSSIIRSRGKKYSIRLENLIDSINWLEKLAFEKCCEEIICLGDFFDKESLNSEEITSLQNINWEQPGLIGHTMLVGNHEMGRSDLEYSSMHVFKQNKFKVINKPIFVEDSDSGFTDIDILYLPYILDSNRKPLKDYFPSNERHRKRIVFSHNDIAGVQMGRFISTSGFSVEEIEENCDLFINGHLHNGEKITDKIINLGNLTGQNFSEDAYKYKHHVMILDTGTLDYELIENPYAFNFYKINAIDEQPDLSSDVYKNAVVTLTCNEIHVDYWKQQLNDCSNIIASRILIERHKQSETDAKLDDLQASDHLEQFKNYVLSTIGDSNVVKEELIEILK